MKKRRLPLYNSLRLRSFYVDSVAVNRRIQYADERQLAILLVIVQPVSNHEFIGDADALKIYRDIYLAPFRFV